MSTDTAPEVDVVRERAIDAAKAVLDRALKLYSPPRHNVAEALDAAATVYDADHDQAVQGMMDRSLMAGMTLGPKGATLTAITAREQAAMFAGMAAQFLSESPGAENYVEQTMQIWDEAKKNRYTVVFEFVRPGKRTPHELRRDAERQRDRLRTVLRPTIAALHVALNHDPTDNREEADDEIAGCRAALEHARDVYKLFGGTEPAAAPAGDRVPLRELIEAAIEAAAGEAYEIGHAHGGNAYRRGLGEPAQRVDDGWGTPARDAVEKIMTAIPDDLVDLKAPV